MIKGRNSNSINIRWAFLIFGIFTLITGFFFSIMYLIERKEVNRPSQLEEKKSSPISKKYKIIVLFLAVNIFLFHVGSEIGFARLLTTFAVYYDLPGLNKQIGAYMTSAFFIGFTFFRLFTIFMVNILGTKFTIFISAVIIVIANCILVFLSSSITGLWVGIVLSGFGTSAVYPTLFALVDEYVTITSKISSLFTIGCVIGEFAIPTIIGLFIKENPMFLIYMTACVSLFCIMLLGCLFFVFRMINNEKKAHMQH